MGYQKIHEERLLALAAHLKTVPDNQFRYSVWVGEGWREGEDFVECGTRGCALGHATRMPLFKDLGLCLTQATDSYARLPVVALRRQGKPSIIPSSSAIDNPTLLEIFEILFGTVDVTHLFVPDMGESQMTPREVAEKIEKWVAKRRAGLSHVATYQKVDVL